MVPVRTSEPTRPDPRFRPPRVSYGSQTLPATQTQLLPLEQVSPAPQTPPQLSHRFGFMPVLHWLPPPQSLLPLHSQ